MNIYIKEEFKIICHKNQSIKMKWQWYHDYKYEKHERGWVLNYYAQASRLYSNQSRRSRGAHVPLGLASSLRSPSLSLSGPWGVILFCSLLSFVSVSFVLYSHWEKASTMPTPSCPRSLFLITIQDSRSPWLWCVTSKKVPKLFKKWFFWVQFRAVL